MKTSRFLLRGFRRPREIACFALGKLERQVMEEIWRLGEVTRARCLPCIRQRIAYTTLMTTLDRLFKKKLLERRKDGRAFLYSAVVSRDELDRGIKEDVVDGLLGQGADGVEPVLACIVDTISERDRELLDELDRLVQEKKRELRERANVRVSWHHFSPCFTADHQCDCDDGRGRVRASVQTAALEMFCTHAR